MEKFIYQMYYYYIKREMLIFKKFREWIKTAHKYLFNQFMWANLSSGILKERL